MRFKVESTSLWTFIATTIAVVAFCAIVGVTGAASDTMESLPAPGHDAVCELVANAGSLSGETVGSNAIVEDTYRGKGRQIRPSDTLTPTIWLPVVSHNYCLPGAWWCPANDQNLTGKTVFALAGCSNGTLFAGAEDGVYSYTLGDGRWHPEVSTTGEVRGLATSPDCSVVYAAVLDQGIRSRNGGSWELVSTPEMTRARTIVLSGGKILAGGDFGVAYSNLGPNHDWHSCGARLGSDIVTSLVRSDGWVYVAVWCGGVWRFPEDDCRWPPGHPWDDLGKQSKKCVLQAIGSPIDGKPRFAGMDDGWFRWDGDEWERCGNTRTYCFAIDGETVYAGQRGSGVLRSTDDGLTWEPVNDGWGSPSEVRALLVHVDGDGQRWLYAGTTEGMWRYLLDS